MTFLRSENSKKLRGGIKNDISAQVVELKRAIRTPIIKMQQKQKGVRLMKKFLAIILALTMLLSMAA